MATIIVDSLADTIDASDGATTLREALVLANGDAAADTIQFSTSGNIDLSGTEFVISSDVTIDGGGAITIDAQDASRVLSIVSGTSTLKGLTITGGRTPLGNGRGRNFDRAHYKWCIADGG